MLQNLATMLFSPIFTHGFLLLEIDFDNIVLREKGSVGLNHVPALKTLTKIEVASLTTFFSGLIEKDHEQVRIQPVEASFFDGNPINSSC